MCNMLVKVDAYRSEGSPAPAFMIQVVTGNARFPVRTSAVQPCLHQHDLPLHLVIVPRYRLPTIVVTRPCSSAPPFMQHADNQPQPSIMTQSSAIQGRRLGTTILTDATGLPPSDPLVEGAEELKVWVWGRGRFLCRGTEEKQSRVGQFHPLATMSHIL